MKLSRYHGKTSVQIYSLGRGFLLSGLRCWLEPAIAVPAPGSILSQLYPIMVFYAGTLEIFVTRMLRSQLAKILFTS